MSILKFLYFQVQYPRTISSLIRAVFLQFLTLFLFISLQTFDPLHPISWISASIGLLITPTSWFYDLIAIITVSTIGLLYSQQLSCKSWIPKNPISNLTRFFHPQILCSFLAHFVAGGVLMRSYLGLLGGKFNSLTILERSQRFLNVPHMFLVLSGCFQALAIWREFHFNNSNVLAFPLLAQTGNAQLGRQVPKMAKNSVWNVVLNLRWFYAFYAILGHRFVNILSEITRLETSASSFIIVPSLWNHLEMFLQCVLLNGLLTFSLRLLRAILCINFTKRHQFEVEGEKSLTLAMSEDNPPLLSHLAFYDFNLMASESRLRRSHFYILSQPGIIPILNTFFGFISFTLFIHSLRRTISYILDMFVLLYKSSSFMSQTKYYSLLLSFFPTYLFKSIITSFYACVTTMKQPKRKSILLAEP